MNHFSKVVGVILHPVVLSLIGVFIIVYKSKVSIEDAIFWTFLSGLFSLIIGIFVIVGVRKGFFNNLDVSNQKQRIILYPFVILVVILFGLLVYFVNGPSVLIQASIIFSASLMLLDLINSKIKASVHVASVSALSTGLIALYGLYFIPVFLLVPFSAYARIKGKRHTLKEAVVGALCGVILTVAGIFIVQLIEKI